MEQTLEQPTAPQPTQGQDDPFAIDEAQLSTLAPEARQAFDTVAKSWREKAEGYAKTRAEKAAEETSAKYKDYDEQKKYAQSLRELASDPQFQQWYQQREQMRQNQQPQVPQVATS